MGSPVMKDQRRTARSVIVILPDEIDVVNAESVYEQLNSAFVPGVAVVVADMTSTSFCDSSGFGLITLAHQHATALLGQLRLAIPPGDVRRILQLLGLDQVLLVYPTLKAALADHSHSA